MKKAVKFLALALVASSMLVACGGGDEPENPTTPAGMNVTFDGTAWQANDDISSYDFFAEYSAYLLRGMQTADAYPICDVCAYATTAGEYNGTIDDQSWGYSAEEFAYIEYYKEGSVTANGYTYGDWWAYSANLKVNAFDATAMTLDAEVNAVMFDAYEAYGDGGTGSADATHKDMKVTANLTLTASAKGAPAINKGRVNMATLTK